MNLQLTHPALHRLVRQRGLAKLQRMKTQLFAPRRLMLTLLAVVLSLVWLSQVLLSVFMREPADPVMLAKRISFGMMGFTLWQILKVIFRKPVEPFEWTPCERQMLISAPIERSDLVGYRLLTICYSVILKAACFVLVMLPDMKLIVAGFIGMCTGLAFCEFLKTIVELLIHGCGKRERLVVRVVGGLCVGAALTYSIVSVALQPNAAEMLASPAAWKFLLAAVLALGELTQHGLGTIIAWPFELFSSIMLSGAVDGQLLLNVLMGFALAGGTLMVLRLVDSWTLERRQKHECKSLEALAKQKRLPQSAAISGARRVTVPNRFYGVGPIAWRQFVGAWHYRSSIFFSFLVPVILCCIPMFAGQKPDGLPFFLVASVAFYSYLLLPAALMLDFRRDVDRLAVLKALPVKPLNIVLGQLMAPVVLCSVFQGIVFAIGAMTGQATPMWFVCCWLSFIPINLLIMAFENLIFMLHPYRKNKEGLDVFLRTILTFTGKGLTWGTGVALIVFWALLSKSIATALLPETMSAPMVHGAIFFGGAMVFVFACAAILINRANEIVRAVRSGHRLRYLKLTKVIKE